MQQKDAIQALGALAQEHRLTVFRLLVKAGPDGLAAGDIARVIGLTPAALSFHLKELDHAALIQSKREGRFIRYSANFSRMQQLLTFLLEDCCAGQSEDCGVSKTLGQMSCNAPATGHGKSNSKILKPSKNKKRPSVSQSN